MVTERKTERGKTKERRRFGRFASEMPVRTRREAPSARPEEAGAVPCRLRLRDFSLGGVRVESPRPLKIDDQVTVSLPPGGRHPAVHLPGRVVHCRRREDRYDVGIQFHELEAGALRSPYLGLPRLFSMAVEFGATLRRTRNGEP